MSREERAELLAILKKMANVIEILVESDKVLEKGTDTTEDKDTVKKISNAKNWISRIQVENCREPNFWCYLNTSNSGHATKQNKTFGGVNVNFNLDKFNYELKEIAGIFKSVSDKVNATPIGEKVKF